MVQTNMMTTVSVKSIVKGGRTSIGLTTIRRKPSALFIRILRRRILLNSAENAVVNPIENSQGTAMQALSRTGWSWVMLSSILIGIIDDAITSVPMQIIRKKKGCDLITTKLSP